jgi:rRNA maturation endonuclease Nob1
MSTAALLIGLALLVLTIPFVVEPIINEKKKKKFLTDEPEKEETGARYQQILVALRDLDFDRQLDVVSDEDYSVLRTQLLREAAQARTVVELDKAEKEKLDAQIEAAVLTRRGSAVAATDLTCSQCGEAIDANDKFCAVCGTQTADFCPECNRRIDADDKFCAGCGLNLTTAMPQGSAA